MSKLKGTLEKHRWGSACCLPVPVRHCMPRALPPGHAGEKGRIISKLLRRCCILLLCWKLGILPKKSPLVSCCSWLLEIQPANSRFGPRRGPAAGMQLPAVLLPFTGAHSQRLWHWGSTCLNSCVTRCSYKPCSHEVHAFTRDQKLQNIFRRSLALDMILPTGNGNRSSPISLSSAVASTRCLRKRMRLGSI